MAQEHGSMEKQISKRKFLGFMAAVPAGLAALKYMGLPFGISPALADEEHPFMDASGVFAVPALPYPKNALVAAIDEKTMELHHGKHHQSYVDNLNKAVDADTSLKGKKLVEILESVSKYPAAVRNNAGGHWNHTFFWKIMTPEKTAPSEKLVSAIKDSFGSMEDFKKKFEETGAKQFGSGWVWLIVDQDKKLQVISTPNQDNPLMDDAKVKGTPILGNDVWEHAYYLRYFNKRGDYLKNWWNVVNWNRVNDLYEKATA